MRISTIRRANGLERWRKTSPHFTAVTNLAPRRNPLSKEFEQEIAGLEATHPSLTVAMAEVIEILTAAGI